MAEVEDWYEGSSYIRDVDPDSCKLNAVVYTKSISFWVFIFGQCFHIGPVRWDLRAAQLIICNSLPSR